MKARWFCPGRAGRRRAGDPSTSPRARAASITPPRPSSVAAGRHHVGGARAQIGARRAPRPRPTADMRRRAGSRAAMIRHRTPSLPAEHRAHDLVRPVGVGLGARRMRSTHRPQPADLREHRQRLGGRFVQVRALRQLLPASTCGPMRSWSLAIISRAPACTPGRLCSVFASPSAMARAMVGMGSARALGPPPARAGARPVAVRRRAQLGLKAHQHGHARSGGASALTVG